MRREEVDVRLEGRLEVLGPVLEVGEDGQVRSVQRVEARPEDVGDASLVDEHGHLGLAHGELAAVLDLGVGHGIAPNENAGFGLVPLDDVDELFAQKARKRHDHSSTAAGWDAGDSRELCHG